MCFYLNVVQAHVFGETFVINYKICKIANTCTGEELDFKIIQVIKTNPNETINLLRDSIFKVFHILLKYTVQKITCNDTEKKKLRLCGVENSSPQLQRWFTLPLWTNAALRSFSWWHFLFVQKYSLIDKHIHVFNIFS